MNNIDKIWGETKCIFINSNVEIHRIEVKKGFSCSRHYHKNKNNIFYVEKGKLLIKEWKNEKIEEKILLPGESIEIKNYNFHCFVGLEESVAFEIYHTSIDPNDIIRETQ